MRVGEGWQSGTWQRSFYLSTVFVTVMSLCSVLFTKIILWQVLSASPESPRKRSDSMVVRKGLLAYS